MRPSRGMGAVNPKKLKQPKKVLRKDALVPTKVFCGGGMSKGKK